MKPFAFHKVVQKSPRSIQALVVANPDTFGPREPWADPLMFLKLLHSVVMRPCFFENRDGHLAADQVVAANEIEIKQSNNLLVK